MSTFNGNVISMANMLKTEVSTANWTPWDFWTGYSVSEMNGEGYTQRNVSVSDTGLYYMWVYFSGDNLKNIYGYILVDNLEADVAVEGISLPKTEKVEMGKTLTLTPTFTPTSATNKIVTWTSSDETVATVDNAGKVTPKKAGSTIITVTTQDGNKTATCTVTVVAEANNEEKTNNSGTDQVNNGSTDNKDDGKSDDTTVAPIKIPQTGENIAIVSVIVLIIGVSIFAYIKYKNLKGI